jgi:hypothetical protein
VGYYVNPKDGVSTKEKWLETHGTRVSEETALAHGAGYNNRLVVCLIDNGWMTAAGIAYDDRERDVFANPDGRPKTWYVVPKALLEQFMGRR